MLYRSALIVLILFIHACSVNNNDDIDFNTEYLSINNNEENLSERLLIQDTELDLTSEGYEYLQDGTVPMSQNQVRFTLIAELNPPIIEGQLAQATMVDIQGGSSRAAVSYNNRGAGNYEGAIDILQLTSGARPSIRIRSGVEYIDSNTNAVQIGSVNVWAAHASNNPNLVKEGEFSGLRNFVINGFNITGESISHTSIPGYAANSIKEYGGNIYATSGDNAGLSVYSTDLSEQIAYVEIEDARWVDRNEDFIAVLRAGQLLLLDPDTFKIEQTFSIPGADVPEAKNTVELIGNVAVIAAGPEGTHLLDLTNGNIISTIPLPDHTELSLESDVVQSNAASAQGKLIFISNGEAGIYVAEASTALNQYQSGENLDVVKLGKLQFGELESANHVTFRDDRLAVAAGLGGVKIVEIRP